MSRFLELTRFFFSSSIFLVTALGVIALPGVALGADDDQRHADFQRGVAAIGSEKWDEALAIYRKLWEQERTYDVALSLGQVELNLKAYRDAAEHLEFGLRNIPPREEAGVTARARHMLDLARNEVGAVAIRVDRTNAEISIDGKPIGSSPFPGDLFLDPGPHTISATSAGSTPIEQTIQATAGKRITLNLAFGDPSGSSGTPPGGSSSSAMPAPAAPAASNPPEPDTQNVGGGSSARTAVLISGLAVTGVAAAVTVTFALLGSSASSDADDARARAVTKFGENPCATAAGAASPECSELADSLDSRATDHRIANAALFVSVLAGVSTAVTFFLWPSNERPERALRLRPEVGRHTAGALLTGSF